MTSIPSAICRVFCNNFKRYYLKNGDFVRILYCISEMCMKFRIFSKKWWVSEPNYFRYYCFQERLLIKRLKGLAWENHSVTNVPTGSKHRLKTQGITIILFPYEFQVNWVRKRQLSSDLKSQDCLPTHWLQLTSIPAAIWIIFCNNFKR